MIKPEIAVGIDGSRTAERAMLWAASEASLRGLELLIVHAGDIGSRTRSTAVTDYGQALMLEAEATVYDSNATCAVAAFLVDEEPVQLLTRLSEQADLIVVGSHGLSRAMATALGSVAYQVAAHARCPVAIVPSTWELAETVRRPIVVGVSATPGGSAALNYAFTEAARRGVAVTAVRSWWRPDWNPESAPELYETGNSFKARQAERAELILRPMRDTHPDVEVATVVTGEPVEDALLSASQDADLLVLGCRGLDGRRLSRLGRTTSRLAYQAPCPVIVVGHDLKASTAPDLEASDSTAEMLHSQR